MVLSARADGHVVGDYISPPRPPSSATTPPSPVYWSMRSRWRTSAKDMLAAAWFKRFEHKGLRTTKTGVGTENAPPAPHTAHTEGTAPTPGGHTSPSPVKGYVVRAPGIYPGSAHYGPIGKPSPPPATMMGRNPSFHHHPATWANPFFTIMIFVLQPWPPLTWRPRGRHWTQAPPSDLPEATWQPSVETPVPRPGEAIPPDKRQREWAAQ